jgi:hypothetical protein
MPQPQPPKDPQYFISPTGSDYAGSGTQNDPLASVPEALKRLNASGWIGQPIVTLLPGSYNIEGQQWNIPSPLTGGLPVLIQGTYVDSGLGDLTPTGGLQGNKTTLIAGKVSVANTLVASAYKGMFIVFDPSANAISTKRMPVDDNDVNDFNLSGVLNGPPTTADKFHVMDLASKVTWINNFIITGPGYVYLDGIEMDIGAMLVILGTTVIASAMRMKGTNGPDGPYSTLCPADGGTWMPSAELYPTAFGGLAAPVVPCSNRYDGTASRLYIGQFLSLGMPGQVGSFGESGASMDTVTLTGTASVSVAVYNMTIVKNSTVFFNLGGSFSSYFCTYEKMAGDMGGYGENCAFFFNKAQLIDMFNNSVNDVPAANYVFKVLSCPCVGLKDISGSNPLANGPAWINMMSMIEFPGNNTMTGPTPATDVAVGNNAPCSLSDLNTTPAKRVDTGTLSYMGPQTIA